jgi:hypothetical protein
VAAVAGEGWAAGDRAAGRQRWRWVGGLEGGGSGSSV